MTVPHDQSDEWLNEEEREARRRQRAINQPAIDLLRSWAVATPEEIAEQREALEDLERALADEPIALRPTFE
jgi:hypothetical protein